MAEATNESTMREPVLDEKRWGVVCVRLDPTGEYDPRAARTTIHLLDEDADETIAVDLCGVLATETDVYKAFLVRIIVDDEFEGAAKMAIDARNQPKSQSAGERRTSLPNPNEVSPSGAPKPSTPLTNVTTAHNRGLRLSNPKGESWRK